MVTKWLVVEWKSERGWGTKPFTETIYDTRAEADAAVRACNEQNQLEEVPDWYIYEVPDWYIYAKEPVPIEVNEPECDIKDTLSSTQKAE